MSKWGKIANVINIALGVFIALYSYYYLKLGIIISPSADFLPFSPGIALIVLGALWFITIGISRVSASKMSEGDSSCTCNDDLPGEAAPVVTCIDGCQMAKKGRAGAALGINVYNWGSIKGVAGPAGTPNAVITYLETTLKKVCDDPEFKKIMANMDQPIMYQNSAEFGKFPRETSAD